MRKAPQLEIGETTQMGADVESMKYASLAREILCLSVIGRDTCPTANELK